MAGGRHADDERARDSLTSLRRRTPPRRRSHGRRYRRHQPHGLWRCDNGRRRRHRCHRGGRLCRRGGGAGGVVGARERGVGGGMMLVTSLASAWVWRHTASATACVGGNAEPAHHRSRARFRYTQRAARPRMSCQTPRTSSSLWKGCRYCADRRGCICTSPPMSSRFTLVPWHGRTRYPLDRACGRSQRSSRPLKPLV